MAATIFGFEENEIKAQPALVLDRSNNGSWSANHTLTFKADDFANILTSLATEVY